MVQLLYSYIMYEKKATIANVSLNLKYNEIRNDKPTLIEFSKVIMIKEFFKNSAQKIIRNSNIVPNDKFDLLPFLTTNDDFTKILLQHYIVLKIFLYFK